MSRVLPWVDRLMAFALVFVAGYTLANVLTTDRLRAVRIEAASADARSEVFKSTFDLALQRCGVQ